MIIAYTRIYVDSAFKDAPPLGGNRDSSPTGQFTDTHFEDSSLTEWKTVRHYPVIWIAIQISFDQLILSTRQYDIATNNTFQELHFVSELFYNQVIRLNPLNDSVYSVNIMLFYWIFLQFTYIETTGVYTYSLKDAGCSCVKISK